MLVKNKAKKDKVIELCNRTLGVKTTPKLIRHLLEEIVECLNISSTIALSKKRFKLLNKGTQDALLAAPKIKKLKVNTIYDFEPELEGCFVDYSKMDM